MCENLFKIVKFLGIFFEMKVLKKLCFDLKIHYFNQIIRFFVSKQRKYRFYYFFAVSHGELVRTTKLLLIKQC